jgi:hypothetical protein
MPTAKRKTRNYPSSFSWPPNEACGAEAGAFLAAAINPEK